MKNQPYIFANGTFASHFSEVRWMGTDTRNAFLSSAKRTT